MRRPWLSWMPGGLAATILAGILHGCGMTAPTTGPSPTPRPTLEPIATPGPQVIDPRPLMALVQRQVSSTTNWTGIAYTDQINPDGSSDYNHTRLCFKRPDVTAATILEAKQHGKEGTRLIWDGKNQVQVKTYLFGILPFRTTLDVRDSRLLDPYGRSLQDTSTNNILSMLLHPQAVAKYEGLYRLDGEDLDMLQVHSPGSWKGISRETIGISRRLGLPALRYCYDAQGRLIVRQEIHQLRTNVSFPAGTFTLD